MSYASQTAYLDNAATTPLDGRVLEAMLPFLKGEFGNPSSVHAPGVAARRALERAREQVQAALGPARIVFTSGGTEANNLAIQGFCRLRRGDRIVISSVEHPSCHQAAAQAAELAGIPCRTVRVLPTGRLDLEHLAEELTARTSVVALIHGQNEIGTLQPVLEAAALVRARAPRAHLHVDAIQTFGKLPLAALTAAVDSLSLSAHKIHGPKGAGALALFTKAQPVALIQGGGQEQGIRSGTENVAALVGLGCAAELAMADLERHALRLAGLTERIRACLEELPETRVLGDPAARLPTLAAAVISGVPGEVLQHHLEERGLVIGTGSACHAGRQQVSATYAALGLDLEQARSVIRISLSRETTEDEVERLIRELPATVAHIRELSR